MAEFILETSYPSRRIIRLDGLSVGRTDGRRRILLHNLSRYFKRKTSAGNRKNCENIETSPSHVETSSKIVQVPSRYKFRDG